MAIGTCVSVLGFRSAATPYKAGSGACVTRFGIVSAASRVAWAGTTSARAKVPWLPPMHVDPMRYVPPQRQGDKPRIAWNPDVYRFLQYLGDQVLGGINGQTLVEAIRALQQTQAELVATTNYAEQINTYAQSVATSVAAVTQVTQSNGLSGADAVPEPAEPPVRTSPGTEVL